jgi:hypothetical protein
MKPSSIEADTPRIVQSLPTAGVRDSFQPPAGAQFEVLLDMPVFETEAKLDTFSSSSRLSQAGQITFAKSEVFSTSFSKAAPHFRHSYS